MPDDPQPEPSTPAEPELVEPETTQIVDENALPTAEELAAAPDATVRHAPKFGAFITAGALVGMILGLVITALIGPRIPLESDGSGFLPFLDGENAVRTVMAVTGAVVGGFVGGLFAVFADRRSVKRVGRQAG